MITVAKATSLKTIKVKVNKDGTLSKKSLEQIRAMQVPSTADKVSNVVTRLMGNRGVVFGTFIGLTVAYKMGLLDLITPLVGNVALDVAEGDIAGAAAGVGLFGAAGIGIKAVFDKIEKDGILRRREMFMKDIERAQAAIARVTARLAETGDRTPTEDERIRGEAFIAERQEFIAFAEASIPGDDVPLSDSERVEVELIKWSVAMGLSGATIYLLQSHTVSDIVELVPGQ